MGIYGILFSPRNIPNLREVLLAKCLKISKRFVPVDYVRVLYKLVVRLAKLNSSPNVAVVPLGIGLLSTQHITCIDQGGRLRRKQIWYFRSF